MFEQEREKLVPFPGRDIRLCVTGSPLLLWAIMFTVSLSAFLRTNGKTWKLKNGYHMEEITTDKKGWPSMVASADMQTTWARGSTPNQVSPAEVWHLHPSCFPGAPFPRRPAFPERVGSPWQAQEEIAVAQVTGRKDDSFYWVKLCFSRLPVSSGVCCFGARRLDAQMYLRTSG